MMFDFEKASLFTADPAIAIQGEHQKYYVKNVEVTGTTNICKRENNYLTAWANEQGAKGIDTKKYLTHTGNNGTIFHEAADLTKAFIPKPEYKPYLSTVERQMIQFHKFLDDYPITVIKSEMALVHKALKYGGTIDLYAYMGGIPVLIDLKTSDGFYDTAKLQLAAYFELLRKNGYKVDRALIVRFPRDGSKYKIYEVLQLDSWFARFEKHLESYYIEEAQKKINANQGWRIARKESQLWLKDMKELSLLEG